MGTVKEEISAIKDRAVGAAKDAVGAMTGDRKLEKEGEAQNAFGNARQENNDVIGDGKGGNGSISEEIGGLKDRVVGNIKDAVGYVTGDETLQAKGKAQVAQGNARQENNDVI